MIPPPVRDALPVALRDAGVPFVSVGDLCGLAERRDPALARWAAQGPVVVAACYPRAVRWLLHRAGVDGRPDDLRVVNLRAGGGVDDVLRAVTERRDQGGLSEGAGGPADDAPGAGPGAAGDGWRPWYPVIDYDRCRQCRQCLGFCLFGVYGLSPDGKVDVANPRQCKYNCPACARICPEAAIVFPKVGESPINGDEIRNEEAERARIRVDVEKVLGQDVYAALARRRERARSRLLKREAIERAVAERDACARKDRGA